MSHAVPILTVALPTFNRGISIGRALASLAQGMRGCPPGSVELDIRDNASTDNTAAEVEAFRTQHPWVTVRFTRNASNVGYDRNHQLVWREARGAYLLFCSDRYYYGIDFRPVVAALAERQPAALVFSDRFRAVWPLPGGAPDRTCDDWLSEKVGATKRACDGWPVFETTAGRVVASGALKLNWIAANVSDLIIRRDPTVADDALLNTFIDSYMLVVAALLLPFREADGRVVVVPIPWFSPSFEKMHFGGQRHDQLRVAYAQIKLAAAFPFIGTAADVATFQTRVLLRNYLPIASGVAAYQHTYAARDILQFVQDHDVPLAAPTRLLLRGLGRLESKSTLRVLNAAFEATVVVGREARRLPKLARSLAALVPTLS